MFHRFTITLSFLIISLSSVSQEYYLPIKTYDRTDISNIQLTDIGSFGVMRKKRPNVPAHLHTGIDIKRPRENYINEPILSIGEGIVISVRDDGPYAQIIVEHLNDDLQFWVVYEHIAGIRVRIGDNINENTEIARFMNESELNIYGWQFDHFHFEILKIPPIKVKTRNSQPQYNFKTYNLICYTIDELNECYYDPFEFFMDFM